MFRFYPIIATFICLVLLFGVWWKGLVWFVNQIPREYAETETPVDAIVILTGGSERIGYAIELLRQDLAEELFISGVGSDANIITIIEKNESIAADLDNDLLSRITLGYEAEDTKGNALETARWIRDKNYETIRLVTANYHLPRSLLEFHHSLPELTIIPSPVISSNVPLKDWWQYSGTRNLLVSEYHKFIATYLRSLL